ncbi:NEL-type E3 ubiquitin ligase domain-containing protein [Pseudomonas mucidolens]|uniref:RING-type E3 ubiquitin transferase n=1 Tax=Pseudomonas mucidolens TaxID=46679 RepID=A0A1H2M593_9PSED|nr:NEL-type E3 ubiquitin ligase domain-containing protein [Pseudomonas mucidolens]SDU88272.1 C-terminal novel E3 ligase, LRR-interacting [Pseudomonas mucidolens]SQH34523.1 leucine rich repeat domain protein [Pseudomonas mucidolens]
MTTSLKPKSSESGAAIARAEQLANTSAENRHASFIADQLPLWFKNATPTVRAALRASFEAAVETQREVTDILAQVQSIEQFAEPLLKTALTARGWTGINPRNYGFKQVRLLNNLTIFVANQQLKLADTLIKLTQPEFLLPETLELNLISSISRHSLLQAALQNFEAFEAVPGGLDAGSAIYSVNDNREVVQHTLKPEHFALICRDLNLGAQYQRHLQTVFEPTDDGLPAHDIHSTAYRRKVIFSQNLRHEFTSALHLSFMKNELPMPHYEFIKSLLNTTPPALSRTSPTCSTLKITDFVVPGILIFWPESKPVMQQQTCVLYLPNSPDKAFHTFNSFLILTATLSRWLKDPAFANYFYPLIPLRHRSEFIQRVDTVKNSQASLFLRRIPISNSYISINDLHHLSHQDDPFMVTWQLQWAKIRDDARLLVVPTEDEDSKSRLERQATYLNVGLSALTLALGFVPVLGEIMLASSVLQLGVDIYEGISAWQHNDRVEAVKHIFDVAENIASAAITSGALRALKPAPVVETLMPVKSVNGQKRLWRPDLKPYESADISLSGLLPDAQGIYSKDSKQFIKLEDKVYEVGTDTQTQHYFIRHPHDPLAYTPRLTHNLSGAWLHEGETPQQWSRTKLFRRLGPEAEEVSDTAIEYLLKACNVNDDVLHKIHMDNLAPPPILLDNIKRVRLSEKIERFIALMQQGNSGGAEFSALQLELLTGLDGWPLNSVLRVVDAQGSTLKEFGNDLLPTHPRIQIVERQIKNGDVLKFTLESLSSAQIDRLLGPAFDHLDTQITALSRKLGRHAQANKLALLDRLYKADEKVTAEMQVLHRQFPGLPANVMTELLDNLNATEQIALHASGRLPLHVLEEARIYARELRLNRALTGLYFEGLSNADSQRIAWNSMLHLPGWPSNLGAVLRDKHTAEVLSTVGGESAPLNREFYKHGSLYEYVAPSTGEIYSSPDLIHCVFNALLPAERATLGLTDTDSAVALTRKIADQVAHDRSHSATLLGMQPIKPWFVPPMRLASGRRGYTLGGRSGHVIDESRTPLLKDLIRELYPLMSEEQAGQFLYRLQLSTQLTTRALSRLKAELDTLRHDLARWAASSVWTEPRNGPRREVSSRDKRDISQALIQVWRRQTERVRIGDHTGYILDLRAWPVDCLPELSADFGHVSGLFLSHSPNANFPPIFLEQFSNLRILSLKNNHLTEFPLAIKNMIELTDLNLQGNQITLNDRAITVLSGLRRLKSLNLNDNELGRRISVRSMLALEHLYLRNTGLLTWPEGVEALTHLQAMDLRNNAISRIPQDVFSPERIAVNRVTHLHDNPLSADSLRRLELYRREHGISFGITPRRQHRPPINGINNWTAKPTREESFIWSDLNRIEESSDFFRVLEDLSASSQFRYEQEYLRQRVWNVLKAMYEHSELRAQLFEISANPETCADGIPMIFSDLELRYKIFMAQRQLNAGEALVSLARGLYRIELLNAHVQGVIDARIAAIHADQRRYVQQLQNLIDTVSPDYAPEPLVNMTAEEQQGIAYRLNTPIALLLAQRLSPLDFQARIDRVDPLEIQMFYQVHLTEQLDLPARPTSMLFEKLANITPEQLESAKQYVLREDTPIARLAHLEKLVFWEAFLEKKYPDSFRKIDSPLHKRLEGIFLAREKLSSQEYVIQTKNVQENRRKAREGLIHRLTAEEIEKHRSPPTDKPSRASVDQA